MQTTASAHTSYHLPVGGMPLPGTSATVLLFLFILCVVSISAMDSVPRNNGALLTFFAFSVFRYLRLIVSIVSYATFKPRPIPEKPRNRPENATVVIPTTFADPGALVQCLRNILDCGPAAVIIVTANANVELIKTCCSLNSFRGVQVFGVVKLNKRFQMLKALRQVHTEITVLADDDVFWPRRYLSYLLAAFENPKVGAAGTRQRVRRNSSPSIWNFLGIAYLERRNFNTGATNHIDGSTSTLSGRTAAYRTHILKNEEFFHHFTHDKWLGYPLNTDDDKCLTRYVYSKGYDIALQFHDNAVIGTTLEKGPKFLSQRMRWSRAHWRGNFTVMTNETYWWETHVWGLYAIYIGQFQSPALLVDGTLIYLLVKATAGFSSEIRHIAYTIFAIWLLFTKTVKLIPHFIRHPEDIKFLPVSILFSYLHGIINIYALVTLHRTNWGSQCLEELEKPKAENEEVVPLLRGIMAEGTYLTPEPGE